MFRVIQNKLPDFFPKQKYELTSNPNVDEYERKNLVTNQFLTPQIEAFQLTVCSFLVMRFSLDINFTNDEAVERFLGFCNDKIKSLFKKRKEPLIIADQTFSYSIKIKDYMKNKDLLADLFLALHKTDFFDETLLNQFEERYGYIDCFQKIKEFNENLKEEITALNKANIRGNVIGLFKKPNNTFQLPAEVSAMIADFLPTEKNLALVCKDAAECGRDEVNAKVKTFLAKGLSI